jgi:membrane protein implicated in regulation of membrane protease activity
VEYKGAGWTAVAETALAAGQRATIVGADGLTLRVAPVAPVAGDRDPGREVSS